MAVAGSPRTPPQAVASRPPPTVGSRTSGIRSAVRAAEECRPDEEQDRSPDEQEPGLLGAMGDGRQPEQQADSAAPRSDLGTVRRVHGRNILLVRILRSATVEGTRRNARVPV